jgi:hypothetical protein
MGISHIHNSDPLLPATSPLQSSDLLFLSLTRLHLLAFYTMAHKIGNYFGVWSSSTRCLSISFSISVCPIVVANICNNTPFVAETLSYINDKFTTRSKTDVSKIKH